MTREVTRQDRIYCLKASSDYHRELCEECRFYPNCDHVTQDDMTELTIKDLETLEQEPKTGHWIKEESICGWDGHSYQCSECGRSIHLDVEVEDLEDYPYCHCGAEMQEVKE